MIRNLLTNQATISFRTSGQPISEQLPRHECTSATLKVDDAGHASAKKRWDREDTSGQTQQCQRDMPAVGGRVADWRDQRSSRHHRERIEGDDRPARRQPMEIAVRVAPAPRRSSTSPASPAAARRAATLSSRFGGTPCVGWDRVIMGRGTCGWEGSCCHCHWIIG